MKKILLPIDGSPRSLRTIQVVKQSYIPAETEITIRLVVPDPRPSKLTDENDEVTPMPDHEEITQDPQTKEEARLLVESFAKMLPGYQTTAALRFGSPGPEIIQFAKEGGFDAYFVDHTTGIYPQSASGVPWSAATFQSKGDPITDLFEDMAAEATPLQEQSFRLFAPF